MSRKPGRVTYPKLNQNIWRKHDALLGGMPAAIVFGIGSDGDAGAGDGATRGAVRVRYLSVCAGIEAASVAWHPLGWEAQAFSEIEPFPSAVLAHHYPGVPNWGDMTKFKEWPDANVDVFVGGTPCQSFSVAGLRKGLDDPRGNLMLTYLAIADKYRPRWLVWENVPGVLSSNGGRDFGTFLGGLGQLGYGFAYRVLDAQYFGVPQRRRRVFVVGCLGDWRPAAAVLFEQHSLQGNPAPSRKAGEAVAGTITKCAFDGGASGRPEGAAANHFISRDIAGCLNSAGGHAVPSNSIQDVDQGYLQVVAPPLASCLNAGGMGRQDAESETLIPTIGGGFDDPIAFGWQNSSRQGASASASHTPTLDKSKVPAIAWSEELTVSIECAGTIQYGGQGGRNDGVMTTAPTLTAANDPSRSPQSSEITKMVAAVLSASMQVRRLTPTECERLQGFPDGYTDIPWRKKSSAPDGPRYKALGNSMAVPVMRWIGERIQACELILKAAR